MKFVGCFNLSLALILFTAHETSNNKEALFTKDTRIREENLSYSNVAVP